MHEYLDFAARHWPLVAALGIVLLLLIADEIRRRLSQVREIGPAEGVQMINRGATVIDCRDAQAFRDGHIVSARNIPLAELAGRVAELGSKRNKPALVIGTSVRDSMRAAGILRRNGFASVATIKGGLASWHKDNLPLERT